MVLCVVLGRGIFVGRRDGVAVTVALREGVRLESVGLHGGMVHVCLCLCLCLCLRLLESVGV